MKRTGRFGYSQYETDRYGIGFETDSGFEEYTLNCGDCFQLQLLGIWTSVRIELNEFGSWYLIDDQGTNHDIPWRAVPARLFEIDLYN